MAFEELWLGLLENAIIIMGFSLQGYFSIKLVQKVLSMNYSNYKELREADEKNNYSMVSLLNRNAEGTVINSKPPQADQHFKTILLTVNKLRDEFILFRDDINKKLEGKADKPE